MAVTTGRMSTEIGVRLNEQRSMVRGEYVYVVQMGDSGPIKIGIAGDPLQRLESLQVGNPVQLRLLTSFPGGQPLERELHKRLAKHRMNGEWFRPHPDVMAIIREELYCEGRTNHSYSRYPQCENCGVLVAGDTTPVYVEPAARFCDACEEFAAMRASGIDPFAEP